MGERRVTLRTSETRKGFEGLGIGSALINHALHFAKGAGCYKVVLDCSDTNISFYQKTGFKGDMKPP